MNRRLRRAKRRAQAQFQKILSPIDSLKPPTPPAGTICEQCDIVMTLRGFPREIARTPATMYWFDNDQDPDPDKRKYMMKPVCSFHMKVYGAMWTLHCRQQGIKESRGGEDDLYGFLEPGSSDLEPEELEALMTKSLNERLVREGRSKFNESDVLEAALEWTKDDILIIQAFSKVLDAATSPSGYHSGGPPDIVDQ